MKGLHENATFSMHTNIIRSLDLDYISQLCTLYSLYPSYNESKVNSTIPYNFDDMKEIRGP